MYLISIIPNNTDANVSLNYKTIDSAKAAFKLMDKSMRNGSFINIEDDFKYEILINCNNISYMLFIDIEQAQICKHEQNIVIAQSMKKIEESMGDAEAKLLGYVSPQPRKPSIIQ